MYVSCFLHSGRVPINIKVAPSFWYLNINVPFFFTMFKWSQEDVVQISWRFTVEMLTKQFACFVCIAIEKSGSLKKILKMAGDPKFFLRKFVQFNQFLRRS